MSALTVLAIMMVAAFIVLTVFTVRSEYYCKKALDSVWVSGEKKAEIRDNRRRARRLAVIAYIFVIGEFIFILTQS